jgi:hypothetical protein
VKLETYNGGTFQDPTDEEITAALSNLYGGFAVLSHNEMKYMQSSWTSQDSFLLEYQEGATEEHFRCPDRLSLNEITTAFIAYAKENPSWRSAFRWKKLDIMSGLDIEPQLAPEVARQKKMAIEHSARVLWTLGASLIAGVVVGVGVWFIQGPTDRDQEVARRRDPFDDFIMHEHQQRQQQQNRAARVGLALGLSGATFFFGCLLCRSRFPKPTAKCPQCGDAWDQEGGDDWLTWECCPRCGFKMRDDTGCYEKPSQGTE